MDASNLSNSRKIVRFESVSNRMFYALDDQGEIWAVHHQVFPSSMGEPRERWNWENVSQYMKDGNDNRPDHLRKDL